MQLLCMHASYISVATVCITVLVHVGILTPEVHIAYAMQCIYICDHWHAYRFGKSSLLAIATTYV